MVTTIINLGTNVININKINTQKQHIQSASNNVFINSHLLSNFDFQFVQSKSKRNYSTTLTDLSIDKKKKTIFTSSNRFAILGNENV